MQVRFLNNFVMTVIQTVEDSQGKLTTQTKPFHIRMGDIYPLSSYERHPDGHVDLHFPDSCPLSGVAERVEGDYCEIPKTPSKTVVTDMTPGCGGCGKRRKQ